jgi:hypothetical protein
MYGHLLLAARAKPEPQGALEDVRDLLALVSVRDDDGALLEEYLRDHGTIPMDEAPLELRGHAFFRNVVPAPMRSQFHGGPPLNAADSTSPA